ncbi:MAG TPA: T9SS type A sorting domain-containing protein [Puia sp.]|nr:T9SS type A sorting domain-containing protein [Puia sp.]
MKKICAGVLLILSLFFCQHLQAARFWIAATSSNWNNTANWSATSGGAGGATVPSIGDDVNFDGLGLGNCTIDIGVSVRSIAVAAAYTGTISQGGNTITTVNAASFLGGTFTGGTANITIGTIFTLNGTAFTSTSGILEIDGTSAAFTSAGFVHNSGTVRLNSFNPQALTGISPTFFILEFVGRANTYTLSSTGDITVLNSLNLTGTQFYNITTGIIDVKGNINSSNTATGSGGDATININGNSAQIFTGSTIAGAGAIPQLNINTTGTLALANFPAVSNNFTYTAGTINAGTSTFCFTHGNVGAYSITGTPTLNSISFPVNTSLLTLTIVNAITATSDLTIAGAGNLVLNIGSINVNGNFILTNTGNGGGGSATINIVGAGAENLDGTAVTVNQSRLPVININKTTGTLSLLGNISFASNVTYTAGSIAPGTSTCYVVNNLTITGSFSLNNLTIQAAGGTTVNVTAGSVVTATNTLDLENAANLITINTGTIAVQGNIIDNNTNLTGGGSGTILINGGGAQTITTTGVIDQGRFPSVTINKVTGTLTLPTLMTVRGNWTYTAGTIDVTTNNSTVVFNNSLNITGTHTLNNITFDGSNNWNFVTAVGTTITVLGNISMIGTGNITLNTGTFNLLGNLALSNTGGGGGTSVINISGTGAQAITSALLINQNCLPSVTINKTSGTLTFPALITVRGNWTYIAGIYDVTTNNSTIVFGDPLGSGLMSLTGTHTLNNVTFEANNNHTCTMTAGTVLTITGTLATLGAANMFINTPVIGTTAVQAQGNISIGNTGVGGGGTGQILINGTAAQLFSSTVAASQGLMPFLTIQKTSGTLTMNGIISESRSWTWSSGTVDAATNLSTVVFGGNNLTITSTGMSFYHTVFAASTNTLANSMTILGNLTINGTGILAPAANTINLTGNWTDRATAGFTEATSTVNFNGTALQTITTPGGENFTNLIINNSGPGIQLENNVQDATTLTMTAGNIDLNTNSLTLGLTAVNNGTLTWTSGTIINTGSFIRWFKTTTIAAGSSAGLFPMGTAVDYRPIFISAPLLGPTTGGTVTVGYNDATTNSVVSFADGLFTVVVRKDLNWTMSTAGLAGGLYNMQIQGTDYGLIGAVSDLRLTLLNSVVGIAGVNAGTTSNPQVNRTGLSAANLTNTFYLGSINAVSTPLPVTLVSFNAFLSGQRVDLKWETAIETDNDYFTVLRSKDGQQWETITRINGKGNSVSNKFYETYDDNPLSGQSFYKLENTDFDGQVYFSPVVMVNNGIEVNHVSMYPNPASSTLLITSSTNESYSIKVYNSLGQLMQIVANNVSAKNLDVSGLPAGVYFIHLLFPSFTLTKTVVISK